MLPDFQLPLVPRVITKSGGLSCPYTGYAPSQNRLWMPSQSGIRSQSGPKSGPVLPEGSSNTQYFSTLPILQDSGPKNHNLDGIWDQSP